VNLGGFKTPLGWFVAHRVLVSWVIIVG